MKKYMAWPLIKTDQFRKNCENNGHFNNHRFISVGKWANSSIVAGKHVI